MSLLNALPHMGIGKTSKKMFVMPIVMTCTFCIAIFIAVHIQYRQQMDIATEEFTRTYFNAELSTSNNTIPVTKWFEKTAIRLLQSGNYESFILLDEQAKKLSHVGRPHVERYLEDKTKRTFRDMLNRNNHSYNSTLLTYIDDQQYWIITNTNYQWHTILFLKTLIWGLLGILAIAVLTLKFLSIFQRELISPINHLNAELNKIINSDLPHSLSAPESTSYIGLTNTINKLIEINQDLKNSLYSSIENATQEIRETLESVEIQNIELDMERKKAQQISTIKSELLASTSHEIRTPLNGILGFTQLLLKTSLNDSQKDYLTTIEQSAQSLLMVINDILDYSRLETDTMSLEYKPINVRELIGELFQFYAPSANESHLRLIQWASPDLPDSLLGDPLRLRQVLNNLIHYLISLNNWGDLIVETHITEKHDSKVTLAFRIFNPALEITAQQKSLLESALKSPRSLPTGNSGMGLMIAQTLAERMRGKIELQAQDSLILEFTIELGLATNSVENTSFAHRNIQALICDANPHSQKELKIELLRYGISAAIEPQLSQLALSIRQKNINLILLDCASQGRSFNKTQVLAHLESILNFHRITIAIIAPSNIRRQLEKDLQNNNIFFIQRPLLGAAMIQLLQTATGLPTESMTTPSKHLRILIADDNPSNSKLVQTFLQQLGHITHTVENGAEAIEIFINDKPDIIFMDVQMPLMDGLQATMAIRQHEKNGQRIPIIALTANTQSEQRARILRAGMDDYLTKPVSADDLKHALNRWEKYSPNSATSAGENSETPKEISAIASPKYRAVTSAQISTNTEETQTTRQNREIFSLKESLRLTNHNAQLAHDMAAQLLRELPIFKKTIENPNTNSTELIVAIHKLNGAAAYSGFLTLKKITSEADSALQKNSTIEQQYYAKAVVNAIDAVLFFEEENDIAALFESA